MLRRLELADMSAAALVHRAAFDQALPWLAGLHSPEEDRWFFREHVFKTCEVWGAFDNAAMIGMLAFRVGWIDQLYVLPDAQRSGVGTELLKVAKSSFEVAARRFYEAGGFALVQETDGARNEERSRTRSTSGRVHRLREYFLIRHCTSAIVAALPSRWRRPRSATARDIRPKTRCAGSVRCRLPAYPAKMASSRRRAGPIA
jgi:putative acetyltransferase